MANKRIEQLQKSIGKEFQALLVTDLNNIRYLSGFSGSSAILLVTKKEAVFFTDFRYQQQSAKEVGDAAEIVIHKSNMLETIFARVRKARCKKLAVEKSLSLHQFLLFKTEFAGELIPIGGLIEDFRRYKDDDEVKILKKAFGIADKSFAELMTIIKPGMTEAQVAAHLEFMMKSNGSFEPSFSTIIASGPNASCPHAQPSSRKLKKGEMVKIDFGAVYNGYHSDMTRTVFLGKATDKFKKIYGIVLEAQEKAIAAIKVGKICNEIDAVARKIIDDAGYKEFFGHGLGHSLGLQVHEAPSLSPKCDDKIKAGVAFTVEPGIYLPGWGGVRIEDVFLVKEKGLLRFTNTPNSLLEIKC